MSRVVRIAQRMTVFHGTNSMAAGHFIRNGFGAPTVSGPTLPLYVAADWAISSQYAKQGGVTLKETVGTSVILTLSVPRQILHPDLFQITYTGYMNELRKELSDQLPQSLVEPAATSVAKAHPVEDDWVIGDVKHFPLFRIDYVLPLDAIIGVTDAEGGLLPLEDLAQEQLTQAFAVNVPPDAIGRDAFVDQKALISAVHKGDVATLELLTSKASTVGIRFLAAQNLRTYFNIEVETEVADAGVKDSSEDFGRHLVEAVTLVQSWVVDPDDPEDLMREGGAEGLLEVARSIESPYLRRVLAAEGILALGRADLIKEYNLFSLVTQPDIMLRVIERAERQGGGLEIYSLLAEELGAHTPEEVMQVLIPIFIRENDVKSLSLLLSSGQGKMLSEEQVFGILRVFATSGDIANFLYALGFLPREKSETITKLLSLTVSFSLPGILEAVAQYVGVLEGVPSEVVRSVFDQLLSLSIRSAGSFWGKITDPELQAELAVKAWTVDPNGANNFPYYSQRAPVYAAAIAALPAEGAVTALRVLHSISLEALDTVRVELISVVGEETVRSLLEQAGFTYAAEGVLIGPDELQRALRDWVSGMGKIEDVSFLFQQSLDAARGDREALKELANAIDQAIVYWDASTLLAPEAEVLEQYVADMKFDIESAAAEAPGFFGRLWQRFV